MINTFISAIHSKNKLRVTFYSKEDKSTLVRTCAPMDYGPSRRAHDKSDRLHMWDYDSDTQRHTLSLLPEQIISIEPLGEQYDPKEFVTWNTAASPWFVSRDWGQYS
jgi:hypothetical protein